MKSTNENKTLYFKLNKCTSVFHETKINMFYILLFWVEVHFEDFSHCIF